MPEVIIELDEEQEKRLDELAAEERRTKQQLAKAAVDEYLRQHPRQRAADPEAGWEALMSIVGIADGPPDSSVNHDEIYRRGL